MEPENGNYVTRAELQAHIRPMKEDISDIAKDVRFVRDAFIADKAVKQVSKDWGARKLALASLLVYVISASVGIAAFVHAL